MKITKLTNGNNFIEITLAQALAMSGVYQDDSDLETDMKLLSWIAHRKHRCIDYDAGRYHTDRQQAQQDGVEILIFKNNHAGNND